MAKYDGLTERLRRESAESVTVGFGELDSLVGGLPPSAREHRPWWGNARDSQGQAKAWMDAGWLVDAVDMAGERITFVRGDSDSVGEASQPVRRSLLIRQLYDMLADASGPLKPSDAMGALRDGGNLTTGELSLNNSGLPRYETFLRFVSAWSNKIGWMSKVGGWSITAEGRRAAAELDDERLYPELTKLYRAKLAQRKQNSALATDPKSTVVAQVLSVLDAGEWSTYAEVGELAGLNPQAVGRFINTIATEQGHRVLLADYRCGEDFQWAEFREESQREVLESEGVDFTAEGKADLHSHVGVEDLRDRLETALPQMLAGAGTPRQKNAALPGAGQKNAALPGAHRAIEAAADDLDHAKATLAPIPAKLPANELEAHPIWWTRGQAACAVCGCSVSNRTGLIMPIEE